LEVILPRVPIPTLDPPDCSRLVSSGQRQLRET
jgi:hypothetical protein